MTVEHATTPPSELIPGAAAPQAALPARPLRRSKWRGRGVAALLFVAAGAAGYAYRTPLLRFIRSQTTGGGSAAANVQLYTVHRGTLVVGIVEDGKLKAVNNYVIMLDVNGKIASLAPAGARVKKGDVLVTIDPKPFVDERRLALGDLETARQTLVIAQKAIPIAVSKAASDLAAAKTSADEARLALKLYTTLEVRKQLNDFETQINDARTKLQDAQRKATDAQTQLDDHLEDDDAKQALQQQVDQSKQTVASFQKTLSTDEEQRKLFRAYKYPQDLKSKQQAAKNADLQVIAVQTSGENEVAQKKAAEKAAQELIDRLNANIARLDGDIEKCTVKSPADGLIFYGGPEAGSYYIAEQIRVGADWYSNYPIMTIPDLSAFQVETAIPEVYRGRIATGQAARVTFDAIPGLTLTGRVSKLASVARGKNPWDPSSAQVFDMAVALDGIDPRMVAGMSSRVEITTATYDGVLFVPVEAVFNEGGKTVAYRARPGLIPEKVPVRVGAANDHFVLIAAGLRGSDQVLLSRPDSFYVAPGFADRSALIAAATLPAPETAPAAAPATPRGGAPKPAGVATTQGRVPAP